MTGWTRREFGVALGVMSLAAASGCGGSDDDGSASGGSTGLKKVTYVTGLNVLGRESYVYIAAEKGWFREAGLEVAVRPGVGTEGNLKILQSGQAEFVVVDITAGITEYARGTFKDFTVVSAVQQANLACLMALRGGGITAPKDLAGKKIGYIPGGVVRVLFDAYARKAGVDAGKVTWVNIPAAQLPQALAAGTIDAATQFVVGRPQVENVGRKKAVVLPYSDYLPDLYGNGIAVTPGFAERNPDLVRKFNEALVKGIRYAIDHPDEAGRIYAKHQKVQPAVVATAEVTLMKPYVQVDGAPIGALDRDRAARNIATLRGAGAIASEIDPDGLFSFDLAPKA